MVRWMSWAPDLRISLWILGFVIFDFAVGEGEAGGRREVEGSWRGGRR